jgi:SET domain-containing protein
VGAATILGFMARPVALPKIRRKKSKLHGFGVFAVDPISKNKRIIDYAG